VAELFVGIDWGSRTHTVCVVDAQGEKVLETEVAHRGDAVLAFVDELTKLAKGDLSRVVAAMESPHGVMVEVLLERRVVTYSINPKQLDRFRDRHSNGGAKDDDLDAFVLADSLRTDLKLYRVITLPEPQMMQLSAFCRSYESLTEQVLALANQIRELLVRYYPQMRELGDWHDEGWLWDLFEAAPTPSLTAAPTRATPQGLSAQKVGAILKKHNIRRHDPKLVLASLRSTPLPVAPGVAEAASTQIASLLPVLRAAHQQRSQCSKNMKLLLSAFQKEADSPEKTHHDAALLLSLPGIGVHNGAVMLTEAALALQQRDYQALRRLAGAAPVSKRTGGKTSRPGRQSTAKPNLPRVEQRQACNRRLREATYHWGRVAAQCDPRTRQHYADLRARGHSHGRAIRGVVDRLFKVLLAVLNSGLPYDQERRTAQKIHPLAA
jgi:transposase